MNRRNKVLVTLSTMVFGIGLIIPVCAQDTNTNPPVPASTSMHRAGQDTEGAAKNAYVGTVTAADDTAITTKVKAALASGKGIKSNHIHVNTTAGMVTLKGRVQDSDMSARIEAIARNTKGVRGVTNDLRIHSVQN
jgi:osmotically-inducible protein OsmY